MNHTHMLTIILQLSPSTLGNINLEREYFVLMSQGLAPSEHRAYKSAQLRFLHFCTHSSPGNKWTLCLFAIYLSSSLTFLLHQNLPVSGLFQAHTSCISRPFSWLPVTVCLGWYKADSSHLAPIICLPPTTTYRSFTRHFLFPVWIRPPPFLLILGFWTPLNLLFHPCQPCHPCHSLNCQQHCCWFSQNAMFTTLHKGIQN